MKITVDKEYTYAHQVQKVKDDIKEFKERYTDGDLLRTFCDYTENDAPRFSEIIRVTGEAFPGGTDFLNETAFSINIICMDYKRFYSIRFYCNIDLEVDTRHLYDYEKRRYSDKVMYSCDVYTMTEV